MPVKDSLKNKIIGYYNEAKASNKYKSYEQVFNEFNEKVNTPEKRDAFYEKLQENNEHYTKESAEFIENFKAITAAYYMLAKSIPDNKMNFITVSRFKQALVPFDVNDEIINEMNEAIDRDTQVKDTNTRQKLDSFIENVGKKPEIDNHDLNTEQIEKMVSDIEKGINFTTKIHEEINPDKKEEPKANEFTLDEFLGNDKKEIDADFSINSTGKEIDNKEPLSFDSFQDKQKAQNKLSQEKIDSINIDIKKGDMSLSREEIKFMKGYIEKEPDLDMVYINEKQFGSKLKDFQDRNPKSDIYKYLNDKFKANKTNVLNAQNDVNLVKNNLDSPEVLKNAKTYTDNLLSNKEVEKSELIGGYAVLKDKYNQRSRLSKMFSGDARKERSLMANIEKSLKNDYGVNPDKLNDAVNEYQEAKKNNPSKYEKVPAQRVKQYEPFNQEELMSIDDAKNAKIFEKNDINIDVIDKAQTQYAMHIQSKMDQKTKANGMFDLIKNDIDSVRMDVEAQEKNMELVRDNIDDPDIYAKARKQSDELANRKSIEKRNLIGAYAIIKQTHDTKGFFQKYFTKEGREERAFMKDVKERLESKYNVNSTNLDISIENMAEDSLEADSKEVTEPTKEKPVREPLSLEKQEQLKNDLDKNKVIQNSEVKSMDNPQKTKNKEIN